MLEKERIILHADLDSFFVSVERLKDPSLVGKPVIVGAVGNRGVVSSCSYEARKMGVHSAMSGFQARKLCPHGIFISGDMASYSKYSRIVTEVIAANAPLFEKASIDEFYLDLSGMDKFFGAHKWSVDLRAKIIKETGLPISFGLSINKMLAKMATNAGKPNGHFEIKRGEEQSFLDPLLVSKIPFVGEKLTASLNKLKLFTIADVRKFPIENLIKIYGKTGIMLARKANGLDDSPVANFREEKSISVERTFHNDTQDFNFLNSVIFALTEKLSYELRKLNRECSCITIKIRYQDFSTFSRQTTISPTASTKELILFAQKLFEELLNKTLEVRLLGIKFSQLKDENFQFSLFENTTEKALYAAIDKVKGKYGSKIIQLALTHDLNNIKRNNDVLAELKKQVNRANSDKGNNENKRG